MLATNITNATGIMPITLTILDELIQEHQEKLLLGKKCINIKFPSPTKKKLGSYYLAKKIR